MMLGGVGFQAGLDEARRKRQAARREARSEDLKALHDNGFLTLAELQLAQRKLLGDARTMTEP